MYDSISNCSSLGRSFSSQAGTLNSRTWLPTSIGHFSPAAIETSCFLAIDFLLKFKISRNSQQSVADRNSTRLNSSHTVISYAVFCLKKKKKYTLHRTLYPEPTTRYAGAHAF